MDSTHASSVEIKDDTIHEFVITFRNGALEKIKELADALQIPHDRLGDVLIKGLHLMDIAKDDRIIIERKHGRIEVDLKKL